MGWVDSWEDIVSSVTFFADVSAAFFPGVFTGVFQSFFALDSVFSFAGIAASVTFFFFLFSSVFWPLLRRQGRKDVVVVEFGSLQGSSLLVLFFMAALTCE